MIVEKIRASMKGSREDIRNEINKRDRIDSGSFHVIAADEDEEEVFAESLEKTDASKSEFLVIEPKKDEDKLID